MCPDEQRRRPSPPGPVAALRSTPINMLVDQLAVLDSRRPSTPGFLQRQACDVVADGQSQPDVSATLNYANGILYGVTSSYSRLQVCELTDTGPANSAAYSPSQAEDSQDFSDDNRVLYQPYEEDQGESG